MKWVAFLMPIKVRCLLLYVENNTYLCFLSDMAMPPFFGAREEWESDGAWPPVGTVFVYSFEYPPAAFFVILR